MLMEIEFKKDLTTAYGIICPWASKRTRYNIVATLAPFFLIGSSSFLKVSMTAIGSRIILNSSQSEPITDCRVCCPWAS